MTAGSVIVVTCEISVANTSGFTHKLRGVFEIAGGFVNKLFRKLDDLRQTFLTAILAGETMKSWFWFWDVFSD